MGGWGIGGRTYLSDESDESDESDLSDLSDLSDTYSLTCWLVDLLTCFRVCFFVNNWWEIVFFCVVFSFLL